MPQHAADELLVEIKAVGVGIHDSTAECLPVVRPGGTVVTVSGDRTTSTSAAGVTGLDPLNR